MTTTSTTAAPTAAAIATYHAAKARRAAALDAHIEACYAGAGEVTRYVLWSAVERADAACEAAREAAR